MGSLVRSRRADAPSPTEGGAVTDPFVGELKNLTRNNTDFRRVLFSAKQLQLAVMSLQPGEETGTEVLEVDHLIYVISGDGRVVLDGRGKEVAGGMVVCVPAGVQHNVISAPGGALKLFTVYAPPEHAPRTVHETSADAEAAELFPALLA
jgi:mannose-6-phosphate isomerase-like protein (cupin superfamily)